MSEYGLCVRVLVLVGCILVPSISLGQDPSAEIMQLNEKAMADYQNMKIDAALKTLKQAESKCLQGGLTGSELATTYLNMGVIEAAGRQDNATAMDLFTRALCIDPNIAMDPLVSTPEVETVFNMSRDQAQSPEICTELASAPPGDFPPPPDGDFPPPPDGDFPPPPPGDFPPPEGGFDSGPGFEPPPMMPPPGPTGPVPQSENLRHTAPAQQAKLTPLPLFVLVKPGLEVDKVILNYRTYGERLFQQLTMKKHGEGYAVTIGCDVMQNFNPTAIEYYITVFGPGGLEQGSSGNEMQPHQVNMVDTLVGPPPALPNEAPPTKCLEECPPWNPNCNQGACKQLGDMCDTSAECCEGMVCAEESCVPGEADGGGPLDPFFRMSFSVGTGAGVVFGDTVVPYNQYAYVSQEAWLADPVEDWTGAPYTNADYCASPQVGLGGDLETCYDTYYSREVEISTGVAWSKLHFRINPMFYINEKILLGATFRGGLPLTKDKAVKPVSPLGLLNFAYRVVGEGTDKIELDLMVGVGGGFIYHKIKYPDCYPALIERGHPWYGTDAEGNPYDKDGLGCSWTDGAPPSQDSTGPDSFNRLNEYSEWIGPDDDPDQWENAYFKRSGFFAGELGLDFYFWFKRKLGLNVGLMFDIFAPDLAINGDLQVGLAMRF